MDAIDLLTTQHRELEALLAKVVDADTTERSARFAAAADHLAVHVTAEEQVFYPAVNARRTEDVLLESLEEHLSLKRLVADLLDLAVTDERFTPKFKVLKEQTEHHHEEEEEHLFPKVKKLLDPAAREALGADLDATMAALRRGEPRQALRQQTDEATALT